MVTNVSQCEGNAGMVYNDLTHAPKIPVATGIYGDRRRHRTPFAQRGYSAGTSRASTRGETSL